MNRILLIEDIKIWIRRPFRWLFVLICLFISFQLYFSYIQKECFPILHYGMYSQRFSKQDTFFTYSFYFNKKRIFINKLPDSKREMILSTLEYYLEHLDKQKELYAFENWISTYIINDMRSQSADEFEVFKNSVQYQQGLPVIIESKKVISRKYE